MAENGNNKLKDAQAHRAMLNESESNNRDWDNSCFSELNDFEHINSSSYSNAIQKSDTSTLEASLDSQQGLKSRLSPQTLEAVLQSALDSSKNVNTSVSGTCWAGTSTTGFQKSGNRTLLACPRDTKVDVSGTSQSMVLGDNIAHAKIVLYCEPDSHKFETRTIYLPPNMKCKVGRVFAKSQATDWNGIFDSKVLSRNHAVIWYSEEKKFWVKDTGSSNGTSINGIKLGVQAEELNFGDVIQFGVDVLEKLRNELHRSIVASVALYLPDGTQAISDELKVQPMSYRVENVTHHEALERLSVLLKQNQERCKAFEKLQEVEAAYASADNECKLLRVQVMTSKNSMDEISERLTRMQAEFSQHKDDSRRELLDAKEKWEKREANLLERLIQSDMACASLTEKLKELQDANANATKPSDNDSAQWQKACNVLDAAIGTESEGDDVNPVVDRNYYVGETIYEEDKSNTNELEHIVELNDFTRESDVISLETQVLEMTTKLTPGRETKLLNLICNRSDLSDQHKLATPRKEMDFRTNLSDLSSSCTALNSPCVAFSSKLAEVHKNLQQLEGDMSRAELGVNVDVHENSTDLNFKKNFNLLKQCITAIQEAYNDFCFKTKPSEAEMLDATEKASPLDDNTLSIVEKVEEAKNSEQACEELNGKDQEQQRALAELKATIESLRSEKAALEEKINENKSYIERIEAAMAEAEKRAAPENESQSSTASETETGAITFIQMEPNADVQIANKSIKSVPSDISLVSPIAISDIFDQPINDDLVNMRKIVVKREAELEEYRDRLERTEINNAQLRRQVNQLLQIQIANEFSQMMMRRIMPCAVAFIAIFVYFLSSYF